MNKTHPIWQKGFFAPIRKIIRSPGRSSLQVVTQKSPWKPESRDLYWSHKPHIGPAPSLPPCLNSWILGSTQAGVSDCVP